MKEIPKKFRLVFAVSLLTLVFLAGSFLIYRRFTSAGSAVLYSGSCLGSWQNPYLAQGRPDTLTINKENSAVFSEGGIKEIYCGSFNGDISENEIKLVESVNLKFSWLVSDEELTTATSSIIIIQPPATSTEEVAQNTNYIVNQILNNIDADEVQLIISTTTPEITIIANNVNPEVATTVPASVEASAGEPEVNAVSEINITPETSTTKNAAAIAPISETTSITASSSPTSFWWRKLSFFFADDQMDNMQQPALVPEITTATSSLDSPLSLSEDFLKVSYTLDGVDWRVLGMVNKNNWQDISFQIPVYQLEDVKKIQIKIETLPLVNKLPFVYLDGMALEVSYGAESLGAAISNFFSIERPNNKKLFMYGLYDRSPSGSAISSPVTISVQLENFVADTGGCNESGYWGVAFRYKSSPSKFVFTPLLPASVNIFNGTVDLPPGEITQVGFSCWDENLDPSIQNSDRQEGSIAGDLENIDPETPIFKIVP